MKLLQTFPDQPVALSIGMFDGVHRGHQALLQRLTDQTSPSAVLTFSNHPLTVLRPDLPPPVPITTSLQKQRLLERYGLDFLIVLPFTPAFATLSFNELLEKIPLTHLVLGQGAAFGKNREGTEERVRAWAQPRSVSVEYVEKVVFDGAPVSSTRVRKALADHDVSLAEHLLGYPLSFLEMTHYV
jgi:riboflavin kinase/FMN adenylyltransferase